MAAAKSKDVPIPECLAMIVCDDVVEDKNSSKKTIFNAFNQIAASRFPAKHQKLVVFVSLTSGRGEVPFDLQFVDGDSETVLCGVKGAVKFEDPLGVVDMVLHLAGLPLPKEGSYMFRLFLNGKITGQRRVFAKLMKGGES